MRTNVYLTVDTEHSMGGAWADKSLLPVPTERRIFCRIGGRDHGIGWLCEELAKYNFRATFFAEIFSSLVFGKDDTRNWCRYLLDNGQDVQLHTHLNYYYYAQRQTSPGNLSTRTDDLARLPPATRTALLELACDLFQDVTGNRPVAFRAGNWCANRTLMSDAARMGIRVDSSFNSCARPESFAGESLILNTLQKIDDIWELPLTVMRQSLPEPRLSNGMRPFDLVSLSPWEIRKTLDDSWKSGTTHVVAVLHSFSGVKAKDIQYREFKPDRFVRARLRAFLEHLAANPDKFRVTTLDELALELEEAQTDTTREMPNLGFIHPLARKVVQAVNSVYWL